jgi:hypothetical protein
MRLFFPAVSHSGLPRLFPTAATRWCRSQPFLTAACLGCFPRLPVAAVGHRCPAQPPVTTVSLSRLSRTSLTAAHHRPLLRLSDTAARRSGHSGLSQCPTPISLLCPPQLPASAGRRSCRSPLSETAGCHNHLPLLSASAVRNRRLPTAVCRLPAASEAASHGRCHDESQHLLVGAAGHGCPSRRSDTCPSHARPSPRSATAVRHRCLSHLPMAAVTHSSLSLLFRTAVCRGCPS